MRKPIKPYSTIYYLDRTRYCIHFSASSEPRYSVEGISFDDSGFEDETQTKKISNLVQHVYARNLMDLILKLNKILGTECMGFNHNA
jgi:hypothetical protein